MPQETAAQLVDVSETLMKLHGYHGFSYADVAARVGIKKASVHHHFASKSDLARATVRRYRERIGEALAGIERDSDGVLERLRSFGAVFLGAYRAEGSMCLCAALTADWESLPAPVQEEVSGYWIETREWLRGVLAGDGAMGEAVRERTAHAVVSLFEGAVLCARACGDERPLIDAIETLEVLLDPA